MRIRELRKEKGYTQAELAREISVKQNTIAGYESGVRKPNIKRIKALAYALGVAIEELLEDEI